LQLEQLAAVGPRAGDFLAIYLDAACGFQLLKLGVERLAIGADAGIPAP
jgi:hypothetical protein